MSWDAGALLAVDPDALKGAVLCGPPTPARDLWLSRLRAGLPPGAPCARVPPGITLDRLLGGIDLAATLGAGHPVADPGVLAGAHGGLVVIPMAERLDGGTAAVIGTALDLQQIRIERDGLGRTLPAAFAVAAFDESEAEEPGIADGLADRLGFRLSPESVGEDSEWPTPPAVGRARERLRNVEIHPSHIEALCAAASQLGVASLRAPVLAVAAARAAAALDGRSAVAVEDLELAARLVLAPRATQAPAPVEPLEEPALPEGQEADASAATSAIAERVVDAARAALPANLLAGGPAGSQSGRGPRRGKAESTPVGGRSVGSRAGVPRGGLRVDLLSTLRAAAPWQRVRGRDPLDRAARLRVRSSDLRVRRTVPRTGRTLIFLVDASGSTALQRLAEAKGAVELLLAESYVRRDRVALITFRGQGAELLVPPTRSLARARRLLAALPGGGGTPLAAGLDSGEAVAAAVRRSGAKERRSPLLILLTDGRPNVARDGTGGRARAETDALDAARAIRRGGTAALVIDTSPRPAPFAARLAEELGGRYAPLPAADAARLHQTIATMR